MKCEQKLESQYMILRVLCPAVKGGGMRGERKKSFLSLGPE